MKDKVLVRKWASFLPAWLWCILIDAIDLVTNLLDVVLSFVGIGFITNLGVDAVQGVLSLALFENPELWVIGTGGEALLPPGLDIFPSYTAMYVFINYMKK
jgi:hypothetical protein